MKPLLTTKEAAEVLLVQPSTLIRWRWKGVGPTYVKVGELVRYSREDLEKYIETQRTKKTDTQEFNFSESGSENPGN